MSSLTIRAERALIGALLDDTHRDTDLSYLRAEDFGHRAYRHIYTVITDLRATEPDLHGTQLIAAVAVRAAAPGIDAQFLLELRDTCPNGEHATAYAAMIQAAAFRRDLTAHAARITATIDIGPDPDQRARLAAALTRQIEIFATLTTTDGTELAPAYGGEVAATRLSRAAREDQILADLLRHPEQAQDLARFLPRESFTTSQRRGIYETILVLASAGDAVDEIIVAWEHARLQAYNRTINPDVDEPEPAEPDEVYLARLAEIPITIASAIEEGRDLLSEDTRTALASSAAQATAGSTTAPNELKRSGPTAVPQLDPALNPTSTEPVNSQPQVKR